MVGATSHSSESKSSTELPQSKGAPSRSFGVRLRYLPLPVWEKEPMLEVGRSRRGNCGTKSTYHSKDELSSEEKSDHGGVSSDRPWPTLADLEEALLAIQQKKEDREEKSVQVLLVQATPKVP